MATRSAVEREAGLRLQIASAGRTARASGGAIIDAQNRWVMGDAAQQKKTPTKPKTQTPSNHLPEKIYSAKPGTRVPTMEPNFGAMRGSISGASARGRMGRGRGRLHRMAGVGNAGVRPGRVGSQAVELLCAVGALASWTVYAVGNSR